jgi:molecular chaperone GrpE
MIRRCPLLKTDKKRKIERYAEAEQIGKDDTGTEAEPSLTETPESDEAPTDDEATQLAQARQEAADAQDKYLRLAAEFDNYKKRIDREKPYAHKYLLKELLSVVDNLERAIESSNSNTETDSTSIVEGIDMTLKGIRNILEKFHVTPVESVGNPFDPHFHQAFQQEESNDHPDNTVTQEFQKGYMLNDLLLRPAMVVVSKQTKPPETDPGKSSEQK